MPILKEKLTLSVLARRLSVSTKWVEKAIELLKFGGTGRGHQRVFSDSEFSVFYNIKTLLLCDVSWNEIIEIRACELANVGQARVLEIQADLASKIHEKIEHMELDLKHLKTCAATLDLNKRKILTTKEEQSCLK